ncbi:hypothetical protein KKE26_08095 [bacterium]|nr:hypothetical protein [bacterium]
MASGQTLKVCPYEASGQTLKVCPYGIFPSSEGLGVGSLLLKKEQFIPINRQKWQQMRSNSADECRCGGRGYATLSLTQLLPTD